MKKLLVTLLTLLSMISLTSCSKTSGDKEIYTSLKEPLITDTKRQDKEYKLNRLSKFQLDKNNLDDYPLAIYNIDGNYAIIFENPDKQKFYIGYELKKKIFHFEANKDIINEEIPNLTPVYTQNDFK